MQGAIIRDAPAMVMMRCSRCIETSVPPPNGRARFDLRPPPTFSRRSRSSSSHGLHRQRRHLRPLQPQSQLVAASRQGEQRAAVNGAHPRSARNRDSNPPLAHGTRSAPPAAGARTTGRARARRLGSARPAASAALLPHARRPPPHTTPRPHRRVTSAHFRRSSLPLSPSLRRAPTASRCASGRSPTLTLASRSATASLARSTSPARRSRTLSSRSRCSTRAS